MGQHIITNRRGLSHAVIVDDCHDRVMQSHPWIVALRDDGKTPKRVQYGDYSSGTLRTIKLHRMVTGAQAGLEVDHKNGNPLDNRMENLRICTHRQNMRNMDCSRSKKSGLPQGITRTANGKFMARIVTADAGRKSLGCFATIEEATAVRAAAEREHYGEFSASNRSA